MDSLLRYAYVDQHCNVCGGSYAITLLDALMEQRLKEEWQSPRPCSACWGESSAFAATIPALLLERLESAWQAVRESARASGFELQLGGFPEAATPEPLPLAVATPRP